MNGNERRSKILELLKQNKSMKIIELSEILNVTRETIRKDLYELDEEKLINKVHGGAELNRTNAELDYNYRKNLYHDEKVAIAYRALHLISSDSVIYLDYGSTVYELAKLINESDLNNLLIVTNSLPIVNLLSNNERHQIYLPGGRLRRNEFSFYGQTTLEFLRETFVNIGFFGCGGISVKGEISNYHEIESEISKLMIEHADKSVILADKTKLGNTAFRKIGTFEEVDTIITNEFDNNELKNVIKENHIDLLVAKE